MMNSIEDMVREPEMVRTCRDTGELGAHSLFEEGAAPPLICLPYMHFVTRYIGA